MKTIKEINKKYADEVAFLINEFIEKRCDRVYLRRQICSKHTQQILSLIEELEGKVIGENESETNISYGLRGIDLETLCSREARNKFRDQMRASIKELKGKL